MRTVVVRYRPRPDRADENEQLVEAVFAELAETRPDGLRYTTLRLADGSFLHIAQIEDGRNPLADVAAFAAFQDGIAERCEPGEGPDPQNAEVIGSYGLLGDAVAP